MDGYKSYWYCQVQSKYLMIKRACQVHVVRHGSHWQATKIRIARTVRIADGSYMSWGDVIRNETIPRWLQDESSNWSQLSAQKKNMTPLDMLRLHNISFSSISLWDSDSQLPTCRSVASHLKYMALNVSLPGSCHCIMLSNTSQDLLSATQCGRRPSSTNW